MDEVDSPTPVNASGVNSRANQQSKGALDGTGSNTL